MRPRRLGIGHLLPYGRTLDLRPISDSHAAAGIAVTVSELMLTHVFMHYRIKHGGGFTGPYQLQGSPCRWYMKMGRRLCSAPVAQPVAQPTCNRQVSGFESPLGLSLQLIKKRLPGISLVAAFASLSASC